MRTPFKPDWTQRGNLREHKGMNVFQVYNIEHKLIIGVQNKGLATCFFVCLLHMVYLNNSLRLWKFLMFWIPPYIFFGTSNDLPQVVAVNFTFHPGFQYQISTRRNLNQRFTTLNEGTNAGANLEKSQGRFRLVVEPTHLKKCESKWVHLPQGSGWFFFLIWNHHL